MRSFLALTMLLLGLNVFGSSFAAPEWEGTSAFGAYLRGGEFEPAAALVDGQSPSEGNPAPSLIEIESATDRADREDVAALQPHEASDASGLVEAVESPVEPALIATDISPARVAPLSLDDLCSALLTSAQENDLPVPFFANLIWQESHLRDDAVSPVGAQGIAQFMPRVAMASGLDNPFDPLQAIPASARLLRELRDQFGNLGFVAAAYNAGARRVSEWLEHGRTLPRETRDYVVHVTGRSAEDWRQTPADQAALTFVRRLPCRALPAYADLEHEQVEAVQAQKPEAQPEKRPAQETQKPSKSPSSAHEAKRHVADHKARLLHSGTRQARHVAPAAHEKSRSAHRSNRAKSRLA